MEDIRLSFRLSPKSDSAETWAALKEKQGKSDKQIFDELLRLERLRMDSHEANNAVILADIRRQVVTLLRKIVELLERVKSS